MRELVTYWWSITDFTSLESTGPLSFGVVERHRDGEYESGLTSLNICINQWESEISLPADFVTVITYYKLVVVYTYSHNMIVLHYTSAISCLDHYIFYTANLLFMIANKL